MKRRSFFLMSGGVPHHRILRPAVKHIPPRRGGPPWIGRVPHFRPFGNPHCRDRGSVRRRRVGPPEALREIEPSGRKRPAAYIGYRELREDRSIDVVSLATPDHRHAVQTIWALEAGKDVEVEKPRSHSMFESRQLIAALRQHPRRIAARGTISRSCPALKEAFQKMEEADQGALYGARSLLEMA